MDIPLVEITVEENDLKEGVLKIVEFIKPQWCVDEVKIECNSAGYSNKNYHVHCHPRHDDAIIVRLINPKIPYLHENTLKGMAYLKRRGIGAPILCQFNNGIVMEYVKGESVTWPTFYKIKEPRIWRALARELARFHGTTDWDDVKALDMVDFRAKKEIYQQLDDLLNSGKLTEEAMQGLPRGAEVREIVDEIYAVLDSYNAEVAFCHLDSNPTNVLITGEGICLLDYDYCYPHFAVFNVAYCFETCFNLVNVDFEKMPSDEEMATFVREYLTARNELAKKSESVTEKDVQYFLFLARKARLVVMLHIVVGTIIVQDVSHRKLDFSIAHKFWNRYLQHRNVLSEKFVFDP